MEYVWILFFGLIFIIFFIVFYFVLLSYSYISYGYKIESDVYSFFIFEG